MLFFGVARGIIKGYGGRSTTDQACDVVHHLAATGVLRNQVPRKDIPMPSTAAGHDSFA